MFYLEEIDENQIRFGDVISGFPLSSSTIEYPITDSYSPYNIYTQLSKYSVILDPSCSIGDGKITLSPLIKIPKQFFDNPLLRKDLMKINAYMNPHIGIYPAVWNNYKDNKQTEIMSYDEGYTSLNLFIYEGNEMINWAKKVQ